MFKREPAILKTRPRGDTSGLPADLDISASPWVLLPRLFSGGALVAVSLVFYFGMPALPGLGAMFDLVVRFLPFALILAGAVYLAGAGIDLATRRTAHIERDQVTVSVQAPWGRKDWSEPLGAFDGVRWREFVVHGRSRARGRPSRTKVYQVLDLAHPDPTRCVPLMVTRLKPEIARPEWERFSKLLGVPAIDARGDEVQIRAAEDIDKSVRELADEGKIDAAWQDRPPPRGLVMNRGGGDAREIHVTIIAPRFPVWLYSAVLTGAGVLVVVGLVDLAVLPILFGGGLAAGVIWHWRSERKNPRTLRITRTHVLINTPNPGNAPYKAEIPHRDIESVTISKTRDTTGVGTSVRIATDGRDFETGVGLSRAALGWLRELIISAIANA